MNKTPALNQEDPEDHVVLRSSSVTFICATIIVTVAIISVTVIAIALVIVKKRRRRIEIEREGNEIYGTYDNGPEYNIVSDDNVYYQ